MSDDWGNDPLKPMEGGVTRDEFRRVLNKTFGPGNWTMTSGYRSPAKENELRREGAGTVPAGQISAHSEGDPDAPGAFDFTVRGMGQVQAADKLSKADKRFTKVFAEQGHGREGAHVHAQTELVIPDSESWGNDPLVTPDTTQPPPDDTGKPSKLPSRAARPGLSGARAELVSRVHGNVANLQRTLADVQAHPKNPVNALKTLGAVADYATTQPFSAVGAALDRIVRPGVDIYNRATGQHADTHATTDAILNTVGLLTGLGEEKAGIKEGAKDFKSGVGRVAARTQGLQQSDRAIKANAVRDMAAEGVAPPAWETQGGLTSWVTKHAKGNPITAPYVNAAMKGEADRFRLDANRGAYRRTLAPIGETYAPDGVVGDQGIKAVGQKIGAVYDANLDKISVTRKTVAPVIDRLRREAHALGPEYGRDFDTFIDTQVNPQFVYNRLSGRAWRDTRSAASTESARLERKAASQTGTPRDRQLSRIYGELRTTLNDRAMQQSDATAVANIKKADEAWAMFTRLKNASLRRKASGGVFSADDLLQASAAGQGERFSRGEALLQDYAKAYKAVEPKIPETPANRALFGAGAGAAAGAALTPHMAFVGAAPGALADIGVQHATNALIRHGMERAARRTLRAGAGSPRNYLRAVDSRVSPFVQHVTPPLNALKLISQQQP